MSSERIISVTGLGYVGLPVAVAFARSGLSVIGFDVDRKRIDELTSGIDRTREVPGEQVSQDRLIYTTDPDELKRADFHIVTVPTPIDGANRPDLRALLAASATVGRALKRGDIVVYESSVSNRRSVSPGFIRSGEYPTAKSSPSFSSETRSSTGTHSSSVAPG